MKSVCTISFQRLPLIMPSLPMLHWRMSASMEPASFYFPVFIAVEISTGIRAGTVLVERQQHLAVQPECEKRIGHRISIAIQGIFANPKPIIPQRLIRSSVRRNQDDRFISYRFRNFSIPQSMEYPVLWIIQLENGQIMDISEQYRP